jgi:hypothetical protein
MTTVWYLRWYRSGAPANICVGIAANPFSASTRVGAEWLAGPCAGGPGSGVNAC